MHQEFTSVAHPKLSIGYVPVLTENEGDPTLGIVPGFGHREQHFDSLSQHLARRNISTVRFDFQSAHRNVLSRNTIDLDSYLEGIDLMVWDAQEKTGRRIAGLIGHSQGGLLMQEWLQNQSNEDLVSILLAPVPLKGAKDAVLKIAMHHPVTYAKILTTFFRKGGLQYLSDKEIRQLFFDKHTPADIVSDTKNDLTHTPLPVFLQDILRPYLRPEIQETKRSTLLISSPTDALFPPGSYGDLQKIYPAMEKAAIGGGHDFFIQNADEVATLIGQFLKKHTAQ